LFLSSERLIKNVYTCTCTWKNARLLKGSTEIGYGKNISIKASAENIKDYSMDALTPAVSGDADMWQLVHSKKTAFSACTKKSGDSRFLN
jgi:hypothetical protein